MQKKRLLFFILSYFSFMYIAAQEKKEIPTWEIGYHKNAGETPAKWLPSTVPGAVQLDVMKGENYKQPYWYGNNVEQFDWMEDWYFTYRTKFKKPVLFADVF